MNTFALCIMVPFVSDHSPFNYFGQVWLVRLRQYLHMTILKETDGSIHSAISFILSHFATCIQKILSSDDYACLARCPGRYSCHYRRASFSGADY